MISTEIDEEIGDQQSILAWFSARNQDRELPVAASLVSTFDLSSKGQNDDTAQNRVIRRDGEASRTITQHSVDEGAPIESLGYQRLGLSVLEPQPFNPDFQAGLVRGASFPLLPRHSRASRISRNLETTSGNGHSEGEDKILYEFDP